MKIGIDARVLMDREYSGISEYLAQLLTAIFQQDQTNSYHLFYNSGRDISSRMSVWKRDNVELTATRYPNKIFNYFLQKIFHYPKLDQLLGGVDLFWQPHFNFTSISQGTKTIITVHDLSFLRYPEFFSIRKNFWHHCLAVKESLQKADMIVAISQNTKRDIIELLGISTDKIKVIYSGNNRKNISISDQSKQDFKLKFKIDTPFILYLGNIEPRKNISNLIAAYNQLRSENSDFSTMKLVLAGGSGWKNSQIFRDWQHSPYREDIRFLGYVNDSEKEILYSQAQVFVFPSLYEGFGFPPLEAMSHGVPVVCSHTSSLPEVVGQGAILINPAKSEEISEAIKIAITDREMRAQLIKRGYQQSQQFNWQKTAQEYLDLFKKICAL